MLTQSLVGLQSTDMLDYARSASLAAGQDCTYRNPPIRMMDVHGLEEAVKKMEEISSGGKKEKGRRPRLGNKASGVGLQRFYVSLADSDLKAIVIPEELKTLLLTNLYVKNSTLNRIPRSLYKSSGLDAASTLGKFNGFRKILFS